MNTNHIYWLLFLLSLSNNIVYGQCETYGDQSPILTGVCNRINYEDDISLKIDLPEDLIVYLSGLLIINEVEGEDEMNTAILVWTKRFNDLKNQIEILNDYELKSKAKRLLDIGNLTAVESLLNQKKSDNNLQNLLPLGYGNRTEGNQSPIINGDYASVSYVVNKVIEYKLPEQLTVNLLTQLNQNEKGVKQLQMNVKSLEQTVDDWIKKYHRIKAELANGADAVSKEAYVYFKRGDLDGALRVLQKLEGAEENIARGHFIRAKINLLKLSKVNFEETVEKIADDYAVAARMHASFEYYYDYARFVKNYQAAQMSVVIPYLEKAVTMTNNQYEKAQVYGLLGIGYYSVNIIKSEDYYLKGIELLQNNQNLEEQLIELLTLQNALGYLYVLNGKKSLGNKAFNDALLTAAKLDMTKPENKGHKALVLINYGFYDDRNVLQSEDRIKEGMRLLEEILKSNRVGYTNFLSKTYYDFGTYLTGNNRLLEAMTYFEKAKTVNDYFIDEQAILQSYQQNIAILAEMFKILRYKGDNKRIIELLEIEEPKLHHYIATAPDKFNSFQAMFDVEFALVYLAQGSQKNARERFESAYNYLKINLKNDSNVESSLVNLSACITQLIRIYNKSGETQKAFNLAKRELLVFKKIAIVRPVFLDIFPMQLDMELGYMYRKKDIDSSFYYFKSAYEKAIVHLNKNPDLYVSTVASSSDMLHDIYVEKEEYKEAVAKMDEVLTFYDDLFTYRPKLMQSYRLNQIQKLLMLTEVEHTKLVHYSCVDRILTKVEKAFKAVDTGLNDVFSQQYFLYQHRKAVANYDYFKQFKLHRKKDARRLVCDCVKNAEVTLHKLAKGMRPTTDEFQLDLDYLKKEMSCAKL